MLLSEWLDRYAASDVVRMHMPGHKGELPTDVTELTLPFGSVTDAAEESAAAVARAYGAEHAVLLTGGATLGILSAVTALRGPVIVPRASHKSVWSACALAGLEPIVLDDDIVGDKPVPPSAERIARAVAERPDAVGAVVTSPDYYGVCADLAAIRTALGGRTLIVDAAHGAHFGLSPLLPPAPCRFADCAIVSAHKTLPAPTQTAAALMTNAFARAFAVRHALFATTSPSYPMLAAIERAVLRAATADFAPLLATLADMPYRAPSDDPTRIVLDGKALGLSGREIEEQLAENGVIAEFGGERYCVLIATCADTLQSIARVKAAVRALRRGNRTAFGVSVPHPVRAVPFADCAALECEVVPPSRAAGRIAAAELGFYPPCTPAVVRGEIVDKETLDALTRHGSFGVADGVAVLKTPVAGLGKTKCL